MKYCIPFFILLISLSGCKSSGWIQKNPVFVNSGVFMESIESENVLVSDKITMDVSDMIQHSSADSLARAALRLIIDSYNRGNITSAQYVEERIDAEYVIRVESVDISWVPTVNVVHPGPMYKISIKASAWIGQEKVFESTHSTNANLAVIAADGQRFYIPTDEDKTNSEIQKNTLYPSIRSAFGKVWQEFLQAGNRR